MQTVLGISNCQNSSACLYINGKLKGAVTEERFSRKKLDDSFPYKSVNFLLKKFNIKKLQDLDHIAYSWYKGIDEDTFLTLKNRIQKEKKNNFKNFNILKTRLITEKKRDQIKRNEFDKWIKKNKLEKKLTTFFHHEAHALSATLLSKFNKSFCITADARGDFESLVIWEFNRNKKEPLKKIKICLSNDSMGFFYARITGLLGFKPNRHEGKITGLAAYGDYKKTIHLMKKMIDIKKGHLIGNNGLYFKPFFKPYSNEIKKIVKKYKKEDIAAGAQKHLENIVIKLIRKYIKSKSYNLCLAGGVFSNVKLNGELKKLKSVKNIFVQPQMNDGGLCLGAASGLIHKLGKKVYPMTNCNLGFKNNPNKIQYLIKKYNLLEIKNNKYKSLINFLKLGKVIGIIDSEMEFGPRALMNRSIILKTSDVSCNNWLNKRLNRTEFMPFAPVTIDKLAKKCFVGINKNDETFKYMTSTVNVTKSFKKYSPAVCHIDGTARPQILKKEDNTFIYNLIKKWNQSSKELSLINTSFNSHEEPIICKYEEGIKELKNNVIDVIMLDKRIFINR